MKYLQMVLSVGPLATTVIYALLEHYGVLDRITGRTDALKGLRRLQSTAGFPVSFIYDDDKDKAEFVALERRISRHTKSDVRDWAGNIAKPSLITVAGNPISLDGLPPDWSQEQRLVYTPQHPILFSYGVTRTGGNGKARRVCTIGDLDQWLSRERDARKHWVGAFAIGLFSIALLVFRLSITK